MKHLALLVPLLCIAALSFATKDEESTPAKKEGPLRILFLGHDQKHHNSNEYFPMLAKATGRDAIYFDYHTDVESALGDYDYLSRFDGVLLYANHDRITPKQFGNLTRFVEEGGGFIPVHCASACFGNELHCFRWFGSSDHRDVCPGLGQAYGHALPEPGICSGHKGDFTRQIKHQ